ncbi:hypothetical protein BZA70DRAFT_279520 [Myxozyma melibiosi]|uniref:Uncharacterized protein n=1 Tax=Myxozyma melibiosi TaxID=54550 RepID=A0ABR1F420_9ASCO
MSALRTLARVARRSAFTSTLSPRYIRPFSSSSSSSAFSRVDLPDYFKPLDPSKPLLDWETQLRTFVATVPGAFQHYAGPDGDLRPLTEPEFYEIVDLKRLMAQGIDIAGYFDKSPEEKQKLRDILVLQAEQQQKTIEEDDAHAHDATIVDKIPVKDHHGNVEWEVVRERKKEGWEPLMYYLFLPMMGVFGVYFLFGSKNYMGDWALEELRLQTEEKYLKDDAFYNSLTPEQQHLKQLIVVDRIIAGNYDELISHDEK